MRLSSFYSYAHSLNMHRSQRSIKGEKDERYHVTQIPSGVLITPITPAAERWSCCDG